MQILSIVSAIAALFALPSWAAPISTDWSYQSIHDYAVKMGGTDDPIASLVKGHINSTGKGWQDPYQGDIVINDGGVLAVGNAFHPSVSRRQSGTTPYDGVTGFPWVSDCSSSVYFTWSDVGKGQCLSYRSGGTLYSMYSAYIWLPTGWYFETFENNDVCSGKATQTFYTAEGCINYSDGQGWQSMKSS